MAANSSQSRVLIVRMSGVPSYVAPNAKYADKDILRVGDWFGPGLGDSAEWSVDSATLDELIRETNRYLADGGRVPWNVNGHGSNCRVGWVLSVWRAGNVLKGRFAAEDAETVRRLGGMGKLFDEVSGEYLFDYSAGEKPVKVYSKIIACVVTTNQPNVMNQGPFEVVDRYDSPVMVMSGVNRSKKVMAGDEKPEDGGDGGAVKGGWTSPDESTTVELAEVVNNAINPLLEALGAEPMDGEDVTDVKTFKLAIKFQLKALGASKKSEPAADPPADESGSGSGAPEPDKKMSGSGAPEPDKKMSGSVDRQLAVALSDMAKMLGQFSRTQSDTVRALGELTKRVDKKMSGAEPPANRPDAGNQTPDKPDKVKPADFVSSLLGVHIPA